MAVLVIVDSRHKEALEKTSQSKTDHILLPLVLSSREWAAHDYRLDDQPYPSVSFDDFDIDKFERIYVAAAGDAVGESITRRISKMLRSSNGRVQRLNDLQTDYSEKPADGDSSWRQRAVWETAVETDRRIDAVLRKLLPSAPPSVAGAAVLAALVLIQTQEEKDSASTSAEPKVILTFTGGKSRLSGRLESINGRKISLPHPEYFKALVFDLPQHHFVVEAFEKEEEALPPPQPFHLGSLLAAAEKQLGLPPEETLALALSIHEMRDEKGNRLITSPFTASAIIPDSEKLYWREYLFVNYGRDYVPAASPQTNTVAFCPGAIRPSSPQLTSKALRRRLNKEQSELYSLIWQRTAASLMTEQKMSITRAVLVGGPDRRYVIQAEDRRTLHRGFTSVLPFAAESEHRAISGEIRVGQELKLTNAELQSDSPTAKKFTWGDLADELISQRLCLPEQWFILPQTLAAWKLTEQREGSLHLSEAGNRLMEQIRRACPQLLSLGFLAQLQKKISAASHKDGSAALILSQIDNLLSDFESVNSAGEAKQSGHQDADTPFYGKCPKCANELTVRKGKFGRFVACSAFPKCRYTRPLGIGVKCPAEGCTGEIIERVGKNGDLFYGCSEYPRCRFTSRRKPVNAACTQCGSPYLLLIAESVLFCPQCKMKIAEKDLR